MNQNHFYEFQDFFIPDYMADGIKLYIKYGYQPGDFLIAVICNDLREAVARADDTNMRNLPAYVAYFYNEAPSPCWGSREEMNAWMEATRGLREQHRKEMQKQRESRVTS